MGAGAGGLHGDSGIGVGEQQKRGLEATRRANPAHRQAAPNGGHAFPHSVGAAAVQQPALSPGGRVSSDHLRDDSRIANIPAVAADGANRPLRGEEFGLELQDKRPEADDLHVEVMSGGSAPLPEKGISETVGCAAEHAFEQALDRHEGSAEPESYGVLKPGRQQQEKKRQRQEAEEGFSGELTNSNPHPQRFPGYLSERPALPESRLFRGRLR